MADDADTMEIYLSPRYRRSPFFDATRRHSARLFTLYNRMLLPSGYEDAVSEYWHLVNHVVLWDVGAERQVEIAGPDALAFADRLTPRDLSRCPVGRAKYGVMTAADGGIVTDAVILRLAEDRIWFSLADSDALLWAQGVAVHAGLDVEVREPDASPLQVQGPKSREVLEALVGPKARSLEYYELIQTEIAGIPVVVSRTGWTGERGYEVFLRDAARGVELWDRVLAAGRPHGIRPAAPSNIRRVEAGILNYRTDMSLATNPFEVGLGWTVDLDKASPFIGKEALLRIKTDGPSRRLVGVEVDGAPFEGWVSDFWPVRSEGRVVGHLTVLVHSPRLRKNIGYAFVPTELAGIGTRLIVSGPSGERAATVVRKPFFDPKKKTPKA